MRISFWDKWKGVAIIAVVLIHALGSTANFPVGSLNNDFGIILRQFINFPVGLFIFLLLLTSLVQRTMLKVISSA
jgi:surface polysaccharide O-acyltransferase-like enzyme